MRRYEKLIAELREYWNDGTEDLRNQAADAIEELSKKYIASEVDNTNLTGWLAEEHAKHLWIPVTERVPQDGAEVLAWSQSGFAYVDLFIDGKWKVNGLVDGKYEFVTHWMPLPEPPKGEE